MLDNARPSERVIVRDFFELLDARLVTEGGSAVLGSPAPRSAPPSVTEPLFPMHKKEAA